MTTEVVSTSAAAVMGQRHIEHERALACVLDVLASLNAARLDHAVLPEIVAATTTADRRRMLDAATSIELEQRDGAVTAVVARLLQEMQASGRVVGRDGGYIIFEEDAAKRIVGITTSRRKKTLAIAERAVTHLGRAVRVRDVAEYLLQYLPEAAHEYEPLLTMLARDLHNLCTTRDLLSVGRVRGPQRDGTVLYLPARLKPRREEFMPKAPLTWLDYVVSVFAELWSHRQAEASVSGAYPRPISTKEVRARLRADVGEDGQPVAFSRWGQDLDESMTVQLALDQLAKWSTPALRAVPDRRALWVPREVDLETVALEVSFATDADRTIEATRRAMARLHVPAVTPGEVDDEIALDDALTLSGATSTARVLSDLAKTTVDDGSGRRSPRRLQRVHRVGRKGGANLYCATDVVTGATGAACPELEEARRFAAHGAVLRELSRTDWEARLAALDHVRSPVIALGRARVLAADLHSVLPEVERIAADGYEPARAIVEQLVRTRDSLAGWIRFRGGPTSGVPTDVVQDPPTLTPAELQALFAPVCPTAAALPEPAAVVRLYAGRIKRVRNRGYVSQRSGDDRTAQRYFFDAVDARCFGVRLYGGAQARLAALMVEDELGELRDGRYVLRALAVEDLEQRLRAIAALAFLQPEGTHDVLRQRARNDDSPGVRELAIWALGFCGAPDAESIAREAAGEDPSPHVRRAAQRLLDAGPDWGWQT